MRVLSAGPNPAETMPNGRSTPGHIVGLVHVHHAKRMKGCSQGYALTGGPHEQPEYEGGREQ